MRGSLVLDLACGCGYGSRILHDAGAQVTGVDIDADAVAHAERHFPGPMYLRARAEVMRGDYDALVSLETLEHLDDPASMLRAVRAPLLVASVPNQERYPFDAARFAGDTYPHKRHYTPQEFTELLEGAGYKVQQRWCQRSKIDDDVVRGTDGAFLIYIGRRGGEQA